LKRVLLKISGQSLSDQSGWGISEEALKRLAGLLSQVSTKVELSVTVGGGNIVRGSKTNLDRVTADQMGMLATVINGLALQRELEGHGFKAVLQSAVGTPFTQPLDRQRAIQALDEGRIVIFSGGTGNPFLTTDTAAALRASEIGAKLLLKATKVDGVYTGDPRSDPSAQKLDKITYQEVIARNLGVMDLAAIDLCHRNKIPILVFNLFKEGELQRAILEEPVGTLIN
jgi:uridylate kinase